MMNIAIDGPAGAGKSTIAKKVAQAMTCIYVDTGAMYRAMALYLLKKGIAPEDVAGMEKACEEAEISICFKDGCQRVMLGDEDVTDYLRTDEVSQMASISSAVPAIRVKLVSLQQKLARETSVVMDGRDIGTVVLPDAEVKIFLTASAHVRAVRRFKEMQEKGDTSMTLEEIEASIRERDERDTTREASPLKQAEDAVLLDSSDMTIDQVTDRILEIAHGKC
ncbi:MAG: (d)CMP kinase [Lachnospiraceae bacterium]|nr:(d)CMP kinase [Lachnospiraceae bacterium]